MSTTSLIGIENRDGTISYISCQYDGYLSHNGERLATYFHSENVIRSLIDLGDLFSLGFYAIPGDYVAYKQENFCHSLRYCGYTGVSHTSKDIDSYLAEALSKNFSFIYLFKNYRWQYATDENTYWRPLVETSEPIPEVEVTPVVEEPVVEEPAAVEVTEEVPVVEETPVTEEQPVTPKKRTRKPKVVVEEQPAEETHDAVDAAVVSEVSEPVTVDGSTDVAEPSEELAADTEIVQEDHEDAHEDHVDLVSEDDTENTESVDANSDDAENETVTE